MQPITPCLWFHNDDALEAATMYTELFTDGRILQVSYSAADNPSSVKGGVLAVRFHAHGTTFTALNSSPHAFTPAISLQIEADTQAEADRLWHGLVAGGEPVGCGWVQDRFGVTWQVNPPGVSDLIDGPDREGAARAMQALGGMQRVDVAVLQRAYAGDGED